MSLVFPTGFLRFKNEHGQIIDIPALAIPSSGSGLKIATGTYTGEIETNEFTVDRTFECGFKPKVLIISEQCIMDNETTKTHVFNKTSGIVCDNAEQESRQYVEDVIFTKTGFTLHHEGYTGGRFNDYAYEYTYTAIGEEEKNSVTDTYTVSIGDEFSIDYGEINSDGSPTVTCPDFLTYYDDGGILVFTAEDSGSGYIYLYSSSDVPYAVYKVTVS